MGLRGGLPVPTGERAMEAELRRHPPPLGMVPSPQVPPLDQWVLARPRDGRTERPVNARGGVAVMRGWPGGSMWGLVRTALRATGRVCGPLRVAACRPMAASGPAAVARGSGNTAGIIVIGDEILKVRPGVGLGCGGGAGWGLRLGIRGTLSRASTFHSGLHAGYKLLLHVPATACSWRDCRPNLGGAR